MNRLDKKIVLVTGAAAGIGRAAALAFARSGATVAAADLDLEGARETAGLIAKAGGKSDAHQVDVSSASEVERLFRDILRVHGRIDCAHNNAGIEGQIAHTNQCSEESWDRTLAVNLKGVWLCMKHEIDQMLKQGKGAIVNSSSVAGLAGVQAMPAYVASKHGVIGLTKTAALELAKSGIRVNAVCPGVIETGMVDRVIDARSTPASGDQARATADLKKQISSDQPSGRMGQPDDVAEAVVWLCSDAASYVTGHTLCVDGGYLAR